MRHRLSRPDERETSQDGRFFQNGDGKADVTFCNNNKPNGEASEKPSETPEGSSACVRGSLNSERSFQSSERNKLLKSLFKEIANIRISGEELGTVLLDNERSLQELRSRLEMASMPSMPFSTQGHTSGYGSGAPNVFLPPDLDFRPRPGIDANVLVTSSAAFAVINGAQNYIGGPAVYPNQLDSKSETHLSTDCPRTVQLYYTPHHVKSDISNTATQFNHTNGTVNAMSTQNGYFGTTAYSELARVVQAVPEWPPSNVNENNFNTTYDRQPEDPNSTELIPRGALPPSYNLTSTKRANNPDLGYNSTDNTGT